jgi:hypothetical protein
MNKVANCDTANQALLLIEGKKVKLHLSVGWMGRACPTEWPERRPAQQNVGRSPGVQLYMGCCEPVP